tara:strand:+ start:490 stop:711 length:222 start_codon:yes stop_codon:yes gene_type:complete
MKKGSKLHIRDEDKFVYDKQTYLLKKRALKELFEQGEPSFKVQGELYDLGWNMAFNKDSVKLFEVKKGTKRIK